MTSSNPTAPGTGSSVPAAAPASSDPNTVAVLQTMLNAMATLTQQTQASGATAPAPVVSPAQPPVVVSAMPTGFQVRGPWIAGALYVVVPPQHLTPVAESTPANDEDDKTQWYCITRGKYVGLTRNNFLALTAITGVSGGRMKGYKTQAEALQMFNELLDYHMVSVAAWYNYNRWFSGLRLVATEIPKLSVFIFRLSFVFPPPTPFSMTADSTGEYDDAELLQLIANLDLREVEPPLLPPRTPSPRTPSQTASGQPPPYVAAPHTFPAIHAQTNHSGSTVYVYNSPTRRGRTTDWATAGSATQGVARSSVHAVHKSPKKKSTTKQAYVVFQGLRCGIFLTWSDADPLVTGISSAIHRGYSTIADAEAAYAYAQARGWTRSFDAPLRPIPVLPQPVALDDPNQVNPLHGTERLDNRWFIVYSGISPGVYHSHLECQLNTMGLRGALHESVVGKRAALDNGMLSHLPPLTCVQVALLGNPRNSLIRVYQLLLFAAINTPCYHTTIMVPYPPMKSKYTTDEPTAYQISEQRHAERNEKARLRMARKRAELKTRPIEEQVAAAERERAYQITYRERNRDDLAVLEAKRRREYVPSSTSSSLPTHEPSDYKARHGPTVYLGYLKAKRERKRNARAKKRAQEEHHSGDEEHQHR
ncbi:hypothetical protein B0H13DRAFT_2339566 [Mycena leptocephala]|nr:hypothetical protein B0H13DRAFT_2339566 [Mycena leptocephala]